MKKDESGELKELLKINAEQAEMIKSLMKQISELQFQLSKAFHKLYGTQSEKQKPKVSDDDSKGLKSNQAASGSDKETKKTDKKNGRGTFDESVPRIKVRHELPEGEQFCQDCHNKIHVMGKVITEQLSFKFLHLNRDMVICCV